MRFEPIAIIGASCIFPDALSPAALWANVLAGHRAIRAPKLWELPYLIAQDAHEPYSERTWSAAGGYVENFEELFEPSGFLVPESDLLGLDPTFHWVLHGAREALRVVGHSGHSDRAGLVLGNLSFPIPAMAKYAQSVWLDRQGPAFLGGRARSLVGLSRPRAENRFMSGLPALLAARALGLGAGAFALDAACASSLYAIKLACDALHDRRADLMLAGAVNGADRIFLHVGFCALAAMSRRGESRPFDRRADGLVPAEGAAFVALKRLEDALSAGDTILGLVRGVGLSNDGRGRGLLVPSEEGQTRAMREAYAVSGLLPRDVAFVECHATGTPVGDATELRSMLALFGDARDLPVGSVKANLGHPVTVAGMAGVLKILAAMKAGVFPPMPQVEEPIEGLRATPFRLVHRAEPWGAEGPRRAAVNAFGFGGNNAHLLLEEWTGERSGKHFTGCAAPSPGVDLAVVGLSARVGDDRDVRDFAVRLFTNSQESGTRTDLTLALEGLRMPPNDLRETSAQQLLMFETAREAAEGLTLPRERTAVLIGMGTDPEVARYGARWQVPVWAQSWASELGVSLHEGWTAEAQQAVQSPLVAASVVGTMPNVLANRINSQLDLAGPSFTLAAEELSGIRALELALRGLRTGEIDAAVVGAVDLSDEVVHRSALAELGIHAAPADGAVALVLKRAADARASGEPILALLEQSEQSVAVTANSKGLAREVRAQSDNASKLTLGEGEGAENPLAHCGRSHAASGLLQVATAVLAVHHGALPRAENEERVRPPGAALPWFGRRTAEVAAHDMAGNIARVRLRGTGATRPWMHGEAPICEVFSGETREEVLDALEQGRSADAGPARLVLIGPTAQRSERHREARRFLKHGGPVPDGVAFCAAPVGGELAFVFTGAAAAYPGMARELLLAMPDLAEPFWSELCDDADAIASLQRGFGEPQHPLDQLWACSLVCQAHAALSRQVLGVEPRAVIGYSSGESNQLFAMGAWRDLHAMIRESRVSPIFAEQIACKFTALEQAWQKRGVRGPVSFESYAVAAGVDQVRAALSGEDLVHLTIINSPDDSVIAGDAAACARVLEKLGRGRAFPLGYRLAAHCPELGEIRDAWYALHSRETWSVPNVRFYWNGAEGAQTPNRDGVAAAITQQAVRTLDLPRVIERAYKDGVRVFLEHGPKGLCSRWIDRILGERPHLSIPLDVAGRSSVQQVINAVAWLIAAGVAVNFEALCQRLSPPARTARGGGPTVTLRAHRGEIRLPRLGGDAQRMPVAPRLSPVAEASWLEVPVMRREGENRGRETEDVYVREQEDVHAHAYVQVHEDMHESAVLDARVQANRRGDVGGLGGVFADVMAQQVRVAAVHRAFLETQGSVQGQFLELQQRMLQRLAGGARGQAGQARRELVSISAGAQVVGAGPDSGRPKPQGPRAKGADRLPRSALAALESRELAPVQQVEGAKSGKGGAAHTNYPAAAPHATPKTLPQPTQVASVAVLPTQVGPKFSREELVVHASGRISEIFGPEFAGQDAFLRQVRMPEPPLLLADRVTGLRGEPGSMATGTIWTETDVREDSWYLHAGRMPGGIMIEAGQADLMLISWLGVDRFNRGERVYRLLGCELAYHAELPRPGDTLCYDIHVDGHAQQGDVRLFFFHYDCRINGRLVLSVRNGQAGFFSDAELDGSAGVLWDPESASPGAGEPQDPPTVTCTKRQFSEADLRAFSQGRLRDCFGPGFERAQAHVDTPRIASDRMLLLQRVTDCDPRGGPWQRGYLRAETSISADDWFFRGHFKNDPCMPGTLMFEGCLQAMAFFLAALGFTLERDGYRFEPVPEQRSAMRCRGQVTPRSKLLVYEVFVHQVKNGAIPELHADLLCSVDGLKAFHAQRVGLRLVPDWPLERWKFGELGAVARGRGAPLHLPSLGGLRGHREPKPVAEHAGFPFDYASLLACAWGRPSSAFGPIYQRFDGPRRVARLPGPPYHFMSRVLRVDGKMGELKAGATLEVEYDIPKAVWYFDDNGTGTMPFCVLMEAALQPCGWLASYVGSTLVSDSDLMFRNLDGTATLSGEIRPGAKVLRTQVRLLNVSRSGEMIIESFEVACAIDGAPIYKMNTVFGFFPKEAFENQSGLAVSDSQRARVARASEYALDLRSRPAAYFESAPRLAGGMLCMLDRITGYEPRGGARQLGWARAEKDVDACEWFFKAHFFQDPVQPGSLGIEAFCQLLQFLMREQGMAEGVAHPRFEPVALDRAVTWKYRGQIVPENCRITTEVELVEAGEDERGRYALADAFLWVDGKCIYQAKSMGMRIVAGEASLPGEQVGEGEEVLDPALDTWLLDHCPTWTLPALPMMSMIDRMVGAAQRRSGRTLRRLSEVQVLRWLTFPDGPIRLRTDVVDAAGGFDVTLNAFRAAKDPALSRFEPVATARVAALAAEAEPQPWPPLEGGEAVEDPYGSGTLFHGPAFQMLRSLKLDATGASAQLDLAADGVPPGTLRQGLLDALTHAIPHDAMHRWSEQIPVDRVAYPYRVPSLCVYHEPPRRGLARVEARFAGFEGDPRFPRVDIQLVAEDRVCIALRLVEILLPKGPIGRAEPRDRRAFLRDRAYVSGLGLSRPEGGGTLLAGATLRDSDWLPGNVARIYAADPRLPLQEQVGAKDHVARRARVHPSRVRPAPDFCSAVEAGRPLRRYPLQLTRDGDVVRVCDVGEPRLDLSPVHDYWRRHFAIGPWPVEDLYYGLIEQFVRDVVVSDPEAFAALRGRSVLYLANHQVGIESLLFSVLIGALSEVPTMTLAKAEHRDSWLGGLIKHSFRYPNVADPGMITFFDREDHAALLAILREIAADMQAGKSAMIHVEGTRALSCRKPVVKMSSAVLELAQSVNAPVVPVRFVGGLPVQELPQRLEFPVGYGRQEVWIGRPLSPRELEALPLKERKQRVIDAINGLGPGAAEVPGAPDPVFQAEVEEWVARTGASTEDAVLRSVLTKRSPESALTAQLLHGMEQGRLALGRTAEEGWLGGLARALFGPRGPRVEAL